MAHKAAARGEFTDYEFESSSSRRASDKHRADLLQDCLACFSLAQVCNGIAATLMSLVGCTLGTKQFPGKSPNDEELSLRGAVSSRAAVSDSDATCVVRCVRFFGIVT